jgi:hypothetical protein
LVSVSISILEPQRGALPMNVRSTAPTAAERLLSAFEGAMGITIPVHVR